jgi:hypothetical protein
VKGEDVIMGPKFDTLAKHARKAKGHSWYATFGQEEGGILHKKEMQSCLKCDHFCTKLDVNCKQIQGGVKREQGEKTVAICHNPTPSTRRLAFVGIWL